MDPASLQLLVRLAHVGRVESAEAEGAFLDQLAQHLAARLVEHGAGLHLHQRHLQIGLPLGAHGQPAEVAHLGVGANLEAELVHVEVVCPVLAEHVHHHVRDSLDHFAFLP